MKTKREKFGKSSHRAARVRDKVCAFVVCLYNKKGNYTLA